MKTSLISVLAATLLGIAFVSSGRQFDAANLTAILFTAGLVAWTIEQYSHTPRMLTVVRPLRFPARGNVQSARVSTLRLAA
jgi:hypothetical protein